MSLRTLTLWLTALTVLDLALRATAFGCPGKDGWYADPDFCSVYHRCNYGVDEEYECPAGTAWNHLESRCDWLDNVDCTRKATTSSKSSSSKDSSSSTTKSTTSSPRRSKKPNKHNDGDKDNRKLVEQSSSGQCKDAELATDPDNCNGFIRCKDSGHPSKDKCPANQLFNTETKACENYLNVFCGDRPVNTADKSPCETLADGIYPELTKQCTEFYQCAGQSKTRQGRCPAGLVFSSVFGRCVPKQNAPPPCGSYAAGAAGNSAVQRTPSRLATLGGFVTSLLLFCLLRS